MLSAFYREGYEAALEKVGLDGGMPSGTASNAAAKATAPPEFTRSVDSFTGLASKNRNAALSMKRAMPKSMTNAALGVAAKVMK